MDVKGEVAVTLQNMKEHFTWQSPLGFLPLFALTVKILTQEGESKLHFTLMYQTLCPFELLILLEGGYVLDTGYPQVFFTHLQRQYLWNQSVAAYRLPAQSSFLLEL